MFVCLFVQIFVHQASHRNPPGGGMRTAAPSATEKVFLPGQHFCLFVGCVFYLFFYEDDDDYCRPWLACFFDCFFWSPIFVVAILLV